MSDASVRANDNDARQSLLRFWMAISAVWLTFWLLIAGLCLAILEIPHSFPAELAPFCFIVLTPPAALLAIGFLARWIFQTFAETPLHTRVRR